MSRLNELKNIVENQQTVRTNRLKRIYADIYKMVAGLKSSIKEQRLAYNKLHRDFQKVRHSADKRQKAMIEYEKLKVEHRRLQEEYRRLKGEE